MSEVPKLLSGILGAVSDYPDWNRLIRLLDRESVTNYRIVLLLQALAADMVST